MISPKVLFFFFVVEISDLFLEHDCRVYTNDLNGFANPILFFSRQLLTNLNQVKIMVSRTIACTVF